jgi:hypothetical protein
MHEHPMFELHRLRGTSVAFAFLLAALLSCRLFQKTIITEWPQWLPKSDWTFSRILSYEMVGKRLSGVLQEDAPPNRKFAASLGSSTIDSAISPEIWDEATPSHRWVHLYGNAIYADGLKQLAEILFSSSLHPDLLVCGFSSGMIAQADDYVDPFVTDEDHFELSPLVDHLKARQFGLAKYELEQQIGVALNRVFPFRKRINVAYRYVAIETKLALFRVLGIPSERLFPPDPAPSKIDAEGVYRGPHLTEEKMKIQWIGLENRGWFNPGYYATSRPGFTSFVHLINRARSAGIAVLIVLLPERAKVRAAVPIEAKRTFDAIIDQTLGKDSSDVIDLRAFVPDDKFHDLIHLDPDGGRVFSARLARELKARLH